jgi:hypothetical protein
LYTNIGLDANPPGYFGINCNRPAIALVNIFSPDRKQYLLFCTKNKKRPKREKTDRKTLSSQNTSFYH